MAIISRRPQRSPLVGRPLEVGMLRERFAAVAAGQGNLVLIGGEAGIGKSRLVAEARQWAEAAQLPVIEGHCFEPDQALPYGLVIDVAQSYLGQHTGAQRAELAGQMPELARLLPELAPLGVGLVPSTPANPEQERRGIAQAMVRLVTQLAANRPVMLILEDLHWSDDGSLDVLLHLTRRALSRPVMLLATYRSDEVGASLRSLLAALDRERLTTEIMLSPLPLPDVETLLRAILDQPQPIRADALQAIYDLTDGNPFFIEEIVRSLIASGDIVRVGERWERRALDELRIPRTIHDAVLRRTALLSAQAGRLLRLAAVAGRQFDFEVLQSLTGQNESELLGSLRELVEAQLVIEESADRFAFRHALTRQAIHSALLARERRALHRSIADTIEQLHANRLDSHLAELSYHFSAGEQWDKALDYAERAGRQALAAPRAAAEHFSRAIDAARHVSRAPALTLYRDRGRALALLGEVEAARADFQSVLALARAQGDRVAEWQAMLDLGDVWVGYDYAQAGHFFEQALALARPLERLPALGASLTRLGAWHLNTERPDIAERYLHTALAIFEQQDDPAETARVIDLLGTVSDIRGDIVLMRQRYERAARLFRALDDRQGLVSALATMLLHGGAYVFETVVVAPHIAIEAIRQEAAEARALARSIDWRAGEAYALISEALSLGPRGDYRAALDAASRGLAIAHEIAHREWMTAGHLCQGVILADLLDDTGAHDQCSRAHALARDSGSVHFLYLTSAYLAEALVRLDDVAAAEEVLARIDGDLPFQTVGQRRIWLARAQIALARGDPARAGTVIERLFASAINLTKSDDIPLLALLRGQALQALDRPDEAETAIEAARRGATERGLLSLVWRSQIALGRLYSASGRSAEAREPFQQAWQIAEEIAGQCGDDQLRGDFLKRVAKLLPADRARSVRPRPSPLTAREHDVAILVARGLSNRAIAAALSIGERTVETHVSNLLGKLGFSGRAQVVAWAIEAELGDPAP